MQGQPNQSAAASATPPSLQSQLLAQVLQQMRTQPQTPIGGTANLVAAALNTFGQQAAGQGGAGQWRDGANNLSGNWIDSPLGSQVGSLFGLGKLAPANQPPQNVYNTSRIAAPDGAGQIVGAV